MDINKIALILDNKIDDNGTTLLATPSPVSTLPVSNLKQSNRSYVFRSTSLDDQAIKGNFAEDSVISAMALTRHNMKGNVRLRLYSQQYQTGEKLYDSADTTDIDSTYTYGDEEVINGTFDTNTTGWTEVGSGHYAIVSQMLRMYSQSNGNDYYVYQAVTTVIGQVYTFSFYYEFFTGPNTSWVKCGTTQGAGDNYTSDNLTSSADDGTHTTVFAATATTTYISMWVNAPATIRYTYFDNISLISKTFIPGYEIINEVPNALSYLPWGSFPWGNVWGTDSSNVGLNNYSIFFDPLIASSFQIDISNGAFDDYYEVNRLFLGDTIQPTVNMSYKASLVWNEDTKQTRTDGGTLYSEPSLPYRRFTFSLDWLSDSERAILSNAIRNAGKREDIFINAYPDTTNSKYQEYSFAGKFTKLPTFTHKYYNIFTSKYTIEES